MTDGGISNVIRGGRKVALGALLALASLGGCQDQPGNGSDGKPDGQVGGAASPNAILCAVAGETQLRQGCTLDRSVGPDGPVLIIRNPDGGFRRFLIVSDGRGLVAADGSEKATVKIAEPGKIDVRVGGDLYRIPVTLRPGSAKQP